MHDAKCHCDVLDKFVSSKAAFFLYARFFLSPNDIVFNLFEWTNPQCHMILHGNMNRFVCDSVFVLL